MSSTVIQTNSDVKELTHEQEQIVEEYVQCSKRVIDSLESLILKAEPIRKTRVTEEIHKRLDTLIKHKYRESYVAGAVTSLLYSFARQSLHRTGDTERGSAVQSKY
jgi:hypothetical protein